MKRWMIRLGLLMVVLLAACSGATDEEGAEEANEDASVQKEDETNSGEDLTDAGPTDVVTINDKTFDKDDLAFYTLMRNIQVEVNRHFDLEQFEGEELEDRNQYWDEQLAYNENINVQLQNLIEIYAMALLAEEKNYYNPPEKLETEVTEFLAKLEGIEGAQDLIADFGEQAFQQNIQEYMDQSLLRDRVVDDLTADIKEENPDITDEELNYELANAYGDLFQDQIDDLQVEVYEENL